MLDGRLDADGVAELERVVAELSRPLRLQLTGLRSMDEAGLEALRVLRAGGIALTGASPYFRLLLGPAKRRKAREPPSQPEVPEAAQGPRRGHSKR